MIHTFTWRCTACPRPRTTVETTEDTPPVCPTCGKVMKTHDCCGVSGATTDPPFQSTNLERRLDVTERLVRELTERLFPVTASDVGAVVLGDCSPLGERVERLNDSLGRLLGGLDLP